MRMAFFSGSRADAGGLTPLISEATERGHRCEPFPDFYHNLDWLFFLGDRPEVLLFVLEFAARHRTTGLAHLSGGDRQFGNHVDEQVRDALSAFAHVHFPCTADSARRLLDFGIPKERVYQMGSTMVDDLVAIQEESIREGIPTSAFSRVPRFYGKPLAIVNPCERFRNIVEEIRKRFPGVAFVEPNRDISFGGCPLDRTIPTMSRKDFLFALRACSCFVGNSSALFLEAQYVGVPCWHFGRRNLGREEAFPGHINSGDDARGAGFLRDDWRTGAHGTGAAKKILDAIEEIGVPSEEFLSERK